ncbi:MAG: hypothetical protein ABI199_03765 [Bacteroidia bacterium]
MGSSIEDSSLDVFTRPDSIQFSLSYNHIYNTSKGKTDYFIVNQDSLFINVGLIYDKGLMFVYQGIYNSDTVRNSNVNFVLFKSQLEGCNSGLCEFNYYYLIELDDEQKVSNSIEYLSKDDNIKDIVVIMDNIIFTKGICNWDK